MDCHDLVRVLVDSGGPLIWCRTYSEKSLVIVAHSRTKEEYLREGQGLEDGNGKKGVGDSQHGFVMVDSRLDMGSGGCCMERQLKADRAVLPEEVREEVRNH